MYYFKAQTIPAEVDENAASIHFASLRIGEVFVKGVSVEPRYALEFLDATGSKPNAVTYKNGKSDVLWVTDGGNKIIVGDGSGKVICQRIKAPA